MIVLRSINGVLAPRLAPSRGRRCRLRCRRTALRSRVGPARPSVARLWAWRAGYGRVRAVEPRRIGPTAALVGTHHRVGAHVRLQPAVQSRQGPFDSPRDQPEETRGDRVLHSTAGCASTTGAVPRCLSVLELRLRTRATQLTVDGRRDFRSHSSRAGATYPRSSTGSRPMRDLTPVRERLGGSGPGRRPSGSGSPDTGP